MLLVSKGAHLCLQQPSISFDRVLSTVEPTGLQAAHCNILLISAQPLLSVCRHKTAVSVCLWLFYWCDTDCVFFVFGCLLSNVKLWGFFYEFWVLFSGQKGDYASSKSVLYSFDPAGRVDMGTISCTISHLSQFFIFPVVFVWFIPFLLL